jgi:hypothetical protein
MKDNQTSRTLWHRLLGQLLQYLLPPVGISVHVDLPLMADSPEADILILRREHAQWTPEQFLLLPDGIRQSQASHILVEFKYTDSATTRILYYKATTWIRYNKG